MECGSGTSRAENNSGLLEKKGAVPRARRSSFIVKRRVNPDAKPARLLRSIWGDKVASWTRLRGCLHASLCGLFSSYCPRLTGWCNSRQAHSFAPLLILLFLPTLPPFRLRSHLPDPSPQSFSAPSPPSSPLPSSLLALFVCHFIVSAT